MHIAGIVSPVKRLCALQCEFLAMGEKVWGMGPCQHTVLHVHDRPAIATVLTLEASTYTQLQ